MNRLRKTLKILGWTLLGLLILLFVVIGLLYMPWVQDYVRRSVIDATADSDMQIKIGNLSVSFPLTLDVEDVEMLSDGMAINVGSLSADVEFWPLLNGKAAISGVALRDACIVMGAPDSVTYMNICAPELTLDKARVALSDMAIDADQASLSGARIAMVMNPDTVVRPVEELSEPMQMSVKIKGIAITDLRYEMRMLPTIDSLAVALPQGQVDGCAVDLFAQTIAINRLGGCAMDLCYLAPDSATVANTPEAVESESASAPWTITMAKVDIDNSKALYTTRGVTPLEGLDFSYIEVGNLNLQIDEFYNQASTLRVPLKLSAKERCGVVLDAKGQLDITSEALAFNDFEISTPLATDLEVSGLLGMSEGGMEDPSTKLELNLDGFLANADTRLMFPAFDAYLKTLPAGSRLYARADINGTSGHLNLNEVVAILGDNARFNADGEIINMFDFANLSGYVNLDGELIDLNDMVKAVTDQVVLPRTSFDGRVDMTRGDIKGTLQAHTEQGRLSLDAEWISSMDDYTLTCATDSFPVNAFMPLLGLGELSFEANATGHGYDPFSPDMRLDAQMRLDRAVYEGYDYKNIEGTVALADGRARLDLDSRNPAVRFNLDAEGNLTGDTYDWTADLNGVHVDFPALGMAEEELKIDANMKAQASVGKDITAHLDVASLTYTDVLGSFAVNDILADFAAVDSTCTFDLTNRDLHAHARSSVSLDSILVMVDSVSSVALDIMQTYNFDVDRLQRAMPPFQFDLVAGHDNALNKALAHNGMGFRNLNLKAANDSTISLDGSMLGLETTSLRLDTINLSAKQNFSALDFEGRVDNRPGTFDDWAHVMLDGSVKGNRLDMDLKHRNLAGKEGYAMGAYALVNDSTLRMSFEPANMTIAYEPWTINSDNYLEWSFPRRHLDANLHMQGLVSSLDIFTANAPGMPNKEELYLNLNNIQIADWMNFNPLAPPMEGSVYASLGVGMEDGKLQGRGAMSIQDFSYDHSRVGTIDSEFNIEADPMGKLIAVADFSIDDHKTVTLRGALNDSTSGSPMALDMKMLQLPLASLNPFLPAGVAHLSGTLNGSLDVGGTADSPTLNGWMQFDTTAVHVDMLGATYGVSSVKIPMEDNVIKFNGFAINGTNNEPLSMDGTVDLKTITSPAFDLALKASNFQICNTTRAPKGAEVYGKGFVGTTTTVKGNMDYVQVKSTINVLSGTNITYVMTDAESVIASQADNDMVKFVNFADTIKVLPTSAQKEGEMAMIIDAVLSIRSGSVVNVDLSADGKNKVRLQPEGTLNFSMMPFSDPRLTGRINVDKGFVRYTPPFMSEKNFAFKSGSYVAFNGEMLNPTLNIHTADQVKASVQQSGQNSRLVNFDVGLDILGTLSSMDMAFDLSTTDDISIANELQTMSAEQRANQAMNLLLYGVYSGANSSSSENLTGNALNSFLASQLNSWAASTIKGVDLTFGIDSYDQTTDGSKSSATSYSYQVSKSLFNDRFKIVVGGNYSTDANSEENFSQNLVNDISFEYFLNSAQTMSVKLFRQAGYESILEGEIIKTGVGFVYKRKITSLRNMFRFGHPQRKTSDNEKK